MDDFGGLIIVVIMISVGLVNFFVSNLKKKQEEEARRALPSANRPPVQQGYPAYGPVTAPQRPPVQTAQPKPKPKQAAPPPKQENRPAPQPVAAKVTASQPADPAFSLKNMDQQDIRSGIIMAEILGKPKALRRR